MTTWAEENKKYEEYGHNAEMEAKESTEEPTDFEKIFLKPVSQQKHKSTKPRDGRTTNFGKWVENLWKSID